MGVFSAIENRIFHNQAAAPEANVEEVLSELADHKGMSGYWRTSIVELLELLDLDSGVGARKALATELGVDIGPHGSPAQNIALQKALWLALDRKLGRVPRALVD